MVGKTTLHNLAPSCYDVSCIPSIHVAQSNVLLLIADRGQWSSRTAVDSGFI